MRRWEKEAQHERDDEEEEEEEEEEEWLLAKLNADSAVAFGRLLNLAETDAEFLTSNKIKSYMRRFKSYFRWAQQNESTTAPAL